MWPLSKGGTVKLNTPLRPLLLCLGSAMLVSAPLHAQQANHCPNLPAASSLQWEEIRNPDLLFCKAVNGDGEQVFSMMVSSESPFNPKPSQRAEASPINGRNTWWYRTQIASRPDVLAREAVVMLANGRVAYFNVQADNDAELRQAYATVATLGF